MACQPDRQAIARRLGDGGSIVAGEKPAGRLLRRIARPSHDRSRSADRRRDGGLFPAGLGHRRNGQGRGAGAPPASRQGWERFRMMETAMRVVSGIQPTGNLHLGNLLGAILRWVRMQEETECLFFLADLHALTVDIDPATLRANVREMAAALIASGIDPAKSTLFCQSDVPAHA